LKRLIAPLIAAGLCASAQATVLTFDDVTSSSWASVPQNYGGLIWDLAAQCCEGWHIWQPTDSYPAHSGHYVAYAHSNRVGVSFADTSIFDGAYFSGYPYSSVSYDLYFHNALVSSSHSVRLNGGPTWLGSGYTGLVDRVQFVVQGSGQYWVMDDFTYHAPSPSTPPPQLPAIPEPETHALMLAGLILLAGVSVRRRRTAAN